MKITIDRDLVEQALEALGSSLYPQPRQMAAIAALKAALESPVQEPFCYVYEYDSLYGLHREFYPREYNGMKPSRTVPLYTAPPQRKPLTEEEIKQAVLDDPMYGAALMSMMRDDVTVAQLRQAISGIVRSIERAQVRAPVQ